MNADYVQPMRVGYTAVLVDSWRNPAEQIRRLTNLLMVVSMLLSTVSPIYQPAVRTTPSFAFPDELRAFASLPARTETTGASTRDPGARPVGSTLAPAWYGDLAHPEAATASVERSGSSLTPTWYDGSAHPQAVAASAERSGSSLTPAWYVDSTHLEAIAAPAELLGDALTPAWFDAMHSEEMDASLVNNAVTDERVEFSANWLTFDLTGAEHNSAPASQEVELLGSSLLPTWYAAPEGAEIVNTARHSTGGSDSESIFFRPMQQESDNECAPSGNVMSLEAPPYPVSRGNQYGDVYTVTIRNNSGLTTTNVVLQIDPNVGFYYLGDSVTVESNISGTLTYSDTGAGIPGAIARITVTGDITATRLDPGEVMTFTFKLATNANAESAQALEVQLYSGNTYCAVSQVQNIQTVRGNLTVQKSPNIRSAWLGNVLSWTVTLRNTGLGTVYHARVADTFGAGYVDTDLSQLPTEPITLEAGAAATFYVTGTVDSCTNLTNTARAWWSIGNQDTTATITDPASSQVDVRFNLVNPNVTIAVSPTNIIVPFCTPMTETVTITATADETAKSVQILAPNYSGFNFSNISSGWTYTNGVFTFAGGYLFKDAQSVLTFDVTRNSTVCLSNNATLRFQPRYSNACDLQFTGEPTSAPAVSLAPDRPSISINQVAPYAVGARETFIYIIDLTATNVQNITDTILVTDTIPDSLIISGASATTGSVNRVGQNIYWGVDTPGSGTLTATMRVTVTVPHDAACSAYSIMENVVNATAPTCPECGLLQSESRRPTYLEDVDGSFAGVKTVSGDSEVCSAIGGLTFTNTYNINLPQTLSSIIFTETLGQSSVSGLPAPLLYQSGSVSVNLNGQDVTSLVTVTQESPELVLDMTRLRELATDVEIAKIGEPAAVSAGETVTYTMVVTNNGLITATNVIVRDPPISGLEIITVTPSVGNCTTEVICALSDLAPSATAAITVVATVSDTRRADIVNAACVSTDGLDNALTNNCAIVRTPVTASAPLSSTDLVIGMSGHPSNVNAGSQVTYTIVVTNSGGTTATNVAVINTLPYSFILVSAGPSVGSCNTGQRPLVCALDDLAVGMTATITVVAVADVSISSAVDIDAQVISDNPDDNLADNQTVVQTHVVERVPLTIAYRAIAQTASLGGFVSRTWHDWSLLYVDGLGSACRSNDTLYMGVRTTIDRGNLTTNISAGAPNACEPESITVNVLGGATSRLTDKLVVTLTLGANDIYTVTGYSGFFAANPPTGVISNGNRITWTWNSALPITAAGYIDLDVLRPCNSSGALYADLSFEDRCAVTFTANDNDPFVKTNPEIYLFLTPARYEVIDKRAVWTVFLINIGDGAAVNAVITNTLGAGLQFNRSEITNASGVLTQTSVGDGNDVQWIIPRLTPGSQSMVRIDVYADVIACTGLEMQAFADASCLGGTCSAVGPQSVSLVRSPSALLSSNRQVAVLPMCETGPIELIVQNASASATEYNFVITETVRYATILSETLRLTVTNRAGTVLTATSEFTPVITTDGYTQTMVWNSDNLPSGDPLRAILDERAAGDIIRIGFLVRSDCFSADQAQVQSKATALDACQAQLTADENAVSLAVTEPDLEVTKLMRNVTVGGGYKGNNVYAGAGDTVVYQVTVRNRGQQQVTHLFVEDLLPSTIELDSLSPMTSSQSGSPPLLRWHEGQTVTLQVNEIVNYYITGTVTANACSTPSSSNRAWAYYGCSSDFSGVCAAASGSVTTTFSTSPSLSLSTPAITIDQCSGGPIVVNFPNNGARAENVVITYTLPPGLAYNGLASGIYPTPTISPSIGATGAITWLYDVIGQEVTTNTLRFNVINAAGVCAASGLITGTAQLGYEDSCGNPFTDVAASSTNITVQKSSVVVSQTPVTRSVVVGQVYTWTVTVTNTGNSPTNNLLVTATVGNGWEMLYASAGAPGGAAPVTTTDSVTWVVGSLAANNTTWTATYSARALDAGSNYRTVVTATTACDDGGCLQSAAYTAYDSPINEFTKMVAPANATIGELVTFTVRADLFGNVPYTSTIVSDTLPTGLGFVTATLYLDQDIDGSPSRTIHAPTSAPATNASGAIVWNLGNLAGQSRFTATITAVVQNIASNYEGVIRTNTASLTYSDDGQNYSHTTPPVTVTVREPLLHIGKSYVTLQGCRAVLFEDNFNDGNFTAPAWTTTGTGWDIISGAVRMSVNGANRFAVADSFTAANFSYSAMLRSIDNSGDIGLIFRYSDTNNHYRFRWNRGGSNDARLERVVDGIATTLGNVVAGPYETNRWYHLEIRASGNNLQVYRDGLIILDSADSHFGSGQIGFYANFQSVAYFDNVLVTHYDAAFGAALTSPVCVVAANDLVTYTLTISNQGMAMGRDLVITDAIPTGTSLHTYTFASSDAGAAITGEPATISGATGALTWTVNQLAAIDPFVTNNHTAITLTVVLAISPTMPAASLLTNQASLTYDSQVGDGPVGVQRSYSGGSHSATVRTVDPPGLSKVVAPFTATIGQIVVYTITVPSTPITAALTNITVTDEIRVNLRVTATNIVANPQLVNPQVIFSGQQVTATFERIEAGAQAQIVVTGVVSNTAINRDGVVVTNTAQLHYTDGIGTVGTSHVLTSNQVSTVLVEPVLQIQKAATSNTGLRAGDIVTYVLTVRHAPTSRSTAYQVVVTDVVPSVLTYNSGSLTVSTPTGAVISTTVGNNLNITVTEYPTPAAPITITYTATVIQSAEPNSTYTNTAFVRHISLPDTPDARTGSGVGVNDYYTNTQATIQTAPLEVSKTLDNDVEYTVGDLITYTVLITLPVGTTRNLIVTDTVPAGLLYLAPTSTVIVTATPAITLTYAITPSNGNGTTSSQAILRLLEPVNNTTGASVVLTWTMQLIVVDDASRTINFNGATKTNRVDLTYVNAQNQTFSLTDLSETTTIYEPLLHIGKSYVTDDACAATLLQDNFNSGSILNWTSSNGAWTPSGGWVHAPSGVPSLLTRNSASPTDFSYSAMVSSTATSGSIGLVFRAQDANNYYRFVWMGTAQEVHRLSGGASTTIAAQTGAAFVANRWYHLEVRAVGPQFTVYIDGQPVLSGSDNTLASGSVGFYVSNNNASFDNVLVTRMGDDGCAVEVGDLITYTLTISNQNRITGYDLVITDVLPAHIAYVSSSFASNDPSAALTSSPSEGDTGVLVWNVNHLTPTAPFSPLSHSWAVITLTARVLDDVSAGVRLTNQALLTYDSMAGSGPVGIERTYSGGSHSTAVRTADATLIKRTYPTTVTIGETFQYTLTFPGGGGSGGIAANLYTATLTDSLPAGFRMVEPLAIEVIVDPSANIDPAEINTSRSTTKTLLVDVTTVPSYTQVTAVITAVVENTTINQDGVSYTNTAALGWFDEAGRAVAPVTSNVVTNTVVEPLLIIEKGAFPTNVRPGDTVFYTLRIYHAPTSTVPAYNVLISDTLASWLSYISGSWEANNDPYSVASTGNYTVELPNLQASFPVIGTSLTAANPLILRYQAVVKIDTPASTIITNVADVQWTSLLTDIHSQGEIRDGSGGVNDYYDEDEAQVSLDQFVIVKSGPLTVTAGSMVTYVIVVENGSPITGRNAYVVDTISFRVTEVTGTFSTPLNAGLCNPPIILSQRSVVSCQLGDLPPHSSGVVTITGRIDPETPDGALVDDHATFYITDSNGVRQEREDEAETQVETSTDLAIQKDGPATANAGELITYTLVVTNVGPSTARGVDAKDILPPGLTFLGGSSTNGACTSSICQIGDMQPGDVVTMVITASVGSDVSGVITNTAQVFSATDDPNQSNNRDTATTTVSAFTTIHVAKVDMTDPVYAGNTYFYQVTVTNTGPAQANDVVITDILPDHVVFEGASPGCTYANRRVTCAAGDLVPGEWFGVLINVRVPVTITDGTLVTNTATITTSTNVVAANSVLISTEPTLLLQAVNNPTDLAITKRVTPATVTAGLSGDNVVTYTLNITNTGLATTTAVQVTDFYPQAFTLLSATTSLPDTRAQCSNGGVCAIDELDIGESAIITLVFSVPANVAANTYTNTAHISSASEDTNLANNTANVPVTVLNSVTLQIAKMAAPNPATPGSDLLYTILVTNTGPSDAANVTVSDTLPAGFTPDVILSSQGGCTSFPCNLGTLAPNAHAWVTINGRIDASARQVSNTARVTSTQTPDAVTASVTPTIALVADVGVTKQGPATVYPGASVVYTLTVRNLGPSIAADTRITDVVPAGLTFASVSGCTNLGGGNQVVCALGDLSAGAVQTILVTAMVDSDVYPGSSLENVVDVTTTSTDNNLLNNRADADTTVLGAADVTIHKAQVTAGPIMAGDLVTYTITILNTGPGMARAVDVKDQLPSGMSLERIAASDGGVCGGTVCQFGDLPLNATRTVTVVAHVDSDVTASSLTNTAGVYSVDDTTPGTANVSTNITTSADVAVTKVDLNDPVGPTEELLYQIVVVNNGPSDAQNVIVTDTLDSNVSFVSASSGCALNGGAVVCTVGTLAANASASYLLTVRVSDVATGTVLTNNVVVTTTTSDPDPDNNSASATTTVQQQFGPTADVGIAKSGAASVIAGNTVTYTLSVTNAGPQAATNVRVLELVPADTTVVSMTPSNPDAEGEYCSLGGACYLGTVYSGTTATIEVVLRVNSDYTGGSLVNSAQVSADQHDPVQSNNYDDAATTAGTSADLAVVKTSLMNPAYAGQEILYQIVVTNTGPSDAQAVVITDTLPANTSYNGASIFCTETSGVVRCEVGDLVAGATTSVLIQVRADASLVNGSTVTNTVRTGSDTTDPVSVNDSFTATTTVNQPAGSVVDLAIAKSAMASVIAGERVTYTLVVTNNGPATATAVSVVDALPADVRFVSAVASNGGTCNSGVSCLLGDLSVGEAVTITIVGMVASDAVNGTTLVNTAQVVSANPDSNPANNTASATTGVTVDDELSIAKVGPATVRPEQAIAYQIVVSNTGSSDATNVVVSDTLPATIESAIASASNGTCSINAGLLTCTIERLAAGGQLFIAVDGYVSRSASGSLVNTASVASAADPTGVSDTVTTAVTAAADLMLVKHAPATAGPSDTLVYTLTLRNLGPSTALAVVLTDTLPAETTFVSATAGCGNSGNVVTCTVGNLNADTTMVYTVAVTVDAGVAAGASLENVATANSSSPDPNLLNNTADADTSIVGAASFAIVKEQAAPAGAVTAGSLVTYTITFTNTGPGTARMVDVKDQLPAGLSLVSASAGIHGFCGGAICQFGSLPVGATRTMTVVAQVASDLTTDAVTNVAAVYSVDAGDATTATVATPITTAAALAVSKTALNNPVYAGGVAFYQIVVVNNGPSDARSVVVTDTLPMSTTYAGGDAACNAADEVITCAIGDLPAGASRSLLVQAHVDRLTADGLTRTNLVTATSPTPGVPVTATATITVVQPTGGDADLAIRKDGPGTVTAGEQITYTLVVTNYGPAHATDVQLVDALPAGVRFVGTVASQGVCAAGVSCQLADLPLNATAAITVVGLVDSDVISGAMLVNTARVDAANADPVSGNNQATANTDVQAEARLMIVKDVTPATTTPGAAIAYRIVVTNSGPSTARNVVVADILPTELVNATVSSSQGACTGFPCALGDIAPAGSATILVSGAVAQGVIGIFTNTANLTTATALAAGSITSDDAVAHVTALADLLLILASTPTTIAGEAAVVTATVSNLGPSVAEGAVVTITLPEGASYSVANLPAGWYVAATVGNTVVLTTSDPFAANATVALPITVNISNTVPPGSSLQFGGEVGALTSDPNPTNNRSNADLSVIGQADLVVSKAGPATATAGATVTYTVLVTNTGPTAAVLRDIKDTLPAGVTLVSAALTRRDGSTTACAAGICQAAGTLAVGEVVTMTVVGFVAANTPAGSVLTNTATAFTDGVTPDPNPANNQASIATTIDAAAALRATKVAFNNPVYAGDVIFYQIVVHNDGPSDAQNVVITDTLPVSTTYVGGDVACTHAADVVTCALGTLAANSSRTLQVQARADAATAHGLIVTNLVTATSPMAATPATATVSVTIQQPVFGAVDLVMEKRGPAMAMAGALLTYTLVVTNNGPGIASDVQIVDALPYEVIGLAVQSSQGVCNNSVVCQLGNLAAQASATVTITGWVRTETISGTEVLNTASVSSNNIELTPADNVDALATTVDAVVLMTIEKTTQPTVVTPGGALSYRILVRNAGPSLARNVVMTDLLPIELEAPQLSSSRGYCTAETCFLGDMPPGEIVTILILGNASLAATVSFTNTALLTTTTALDPNSVIQAQVRTDVGDNADLIMFKWAPATVSAGSSISYVLTVRNAGPSTAVNVQVQDELPPSVEVAEFGGCVSVDQTSVLCPSTAIPTLIAGAEISWTLVVSTSSDLPVGTTLQNRATVNSDTPDPNPVNNSTSVETSIIGRSDLGVRKVASSPVVAAGSELTYTIILTNGGPSDATSVRLVDILPSEVRLLHPIEIERSLMPETPVICLDTVCETSMVEEGEIVTFTLHVLVNPAVVHQTIFTNTATVYSPSDPDFSNNVARTPVLAERESALVITKRASPDPAITGAPLTYQIVVYNHGPSTADSVLVGDLLPGGFTVTSVSSSQGACSTLPCALGSLPPNGEATITIVGVVDPLQSTPLVNTAAVTATTPLTNTDLALVTITTTVSALANLSLLLDSTPTAFAGMTATVQAQVINLGPSSAVGTIVTLTLPAGASYYDVVLPPNWYATPNPDATVTLTTTEILLPGASAPLLVHVDLDPGIPPGSSLEFAGEVASLTPDNDPTENHATTDTSIIAEADLAIYKSGPEVLTAGAQVTYIITAENRGPSAASVRDLKDTLPEGVTLQSASLEVAGNGVTACTNAICQVQRLIAVGEVITMTVIGVVDPGIAEGVVLTNTATIFAEGITPDPDESNNQAHRPAQVTTLAQIGIDKYDLTDPVEPDGLLAYVIVVTNTGPSIARNLVVTDTLPPHVTYHSTTGPCSEALPGVVACSLGNLAASARATFLIVVKVNATAPSGVVLRNTATLTSTTPLTSASLFADETTRVLSSGGPQADLEVAKNANNTIVRGGGEVTFTLTVTNHGPSPVRNVQLLDLLPDGLTLVSVRASQGFCNAGISCLLGGLDFGVDATGEPIIVGTATVTVVARAGIELADSIVVTNTAFGYSELTDPRPENNLAEASITSSAQYADVYIIKTGVQFATAGDFITYSLTIGNRGPAAAEHVTVKDPMPVGVRFVSATPAPTGGSASEPSWGIDLLPAGTTTSIQMVVQVDPQAPPALIIVNTASVTSTTRDANKANNQSTATTQSYGAADLEVIKTADREIVYGDEIVYYTITVNNLGPSLSDRVDVKELIPPGTELLSLGATQGVCVSSICQLGNIAIGEPAVITAAIRVISPTFPPGTVLTNTAVAFTNTPDPNPDNNQDGESVTVGPVVNLSALKTSHAQTATVGTVISFTLVVTNHGPSTAPSIIITDHLPYRFIYLSSTAANDCLMHNEVTLVCDAGPLQANRSLSVDVYFFISSIGHGTVTNAMVAGAPGASLDSGEAESELELPTNPVPTGLLLESYTLSKTESAFVITWKTVSEFRTWGFRLWRAETPDRSQAVLLTPEGIPATGVGSTYVYIDENVRERVTYWYWLQELTTDGGGWEYHVLSGRLGPEALYLPLVVSNLPAESAETTLLDADVKSQSVAESFALYLAIVGNGFAADAVHATEPGAAVDPQSPETSMPAIAPAPTPEPIAAPPPTVTLIPTPTPLPLDTPAPLPLDTPTPLPLDTPTPLPLDTRTPLPLDTPTPPASLDTPTPLPLDTPTPLPLDTATPLPLDTPTPLALLESAANITTTAIAIESPTASASVETISPLP